MNWEMSAEVGGRASHGEPDRRVIATATSCPRCRASLEPGEQTVQAVYDTIELSPLKPMAPTTRHGKTLRRRYAKLCGHLFICLTDRDVPCTNNACERYIRPSTTFRRLTGGFRSDWGGDQRRS
jgi:transposase